LNSRICVVSLVLGAVTVSCGGDDGGAVFVDAREPIDSSTPIDSGSIDSAGAGCDPVAPAGAQGCHAGEKCTWITIQDDPLLGTLGCVPDGTVEGGGCTAGPTGETTGYDDCTAGNICIGGTCKDVCGFGGGADAACAVGFDCTPYAGLFENGDEAPVAGACNRSCDPLTQTITGGGTCPATEGCYTLTGMTTTVAVCAAAGTPTHGQPIVGSPFANSCAPGHAPRQVQPGVNMYECGALCRPADVTSTTNMTSEGGVAPYTCEARGASPPDDVTSGESCRYFHAREPFDGLSAFSNTLGFCFKHAIHQYDSNGDMIADAPFPRCNTVTTGDVIPPIGNPPHNDAEYFWCVALPVAVIGGIDVSKAPIAEPRLDRLTGW
jgi:hypothetical protein